MGPETFSAILGQIPDLAPEQACAALNQLYGMRKPAPRSPPVFRPCAGLAVAVDLLFPRICV